MVNRSLRIAVWWCRPCKAISPVLRELANMDGVALEVFLLEGLSDERRRLGWSVPDFGRASCEYLPVGDAKQRQFIESFQYTDYDLHIVNSAYNWWQMNLVIDRVVAVGGRYGVMTEAPFNQYRGLRRIAKSVYVKTLLRTRVRPRAQKAAFVCSLSGEALNARRNLNRMGFKGEAIYRFGYFPDPLEGMRAHAKAVGHTALILCTGYLTQNKGQALLIEAINLVRQRNPTLRFQCVITGYGPIRSDLQRQIEKYGLESVVELSGVVSDEILLSLYRKADLFVAPAYEEPWGIRINDSIQCGVPLVVSDRIGAAELLTAASGGTCFKAGNLHSLSVAIERMLVGVEGLVRAQERLLAYRKFIHPGVAAGYLLEIIRFSLGHGERPGNPPWIRGGV